MKAAWTNLPLDSFRQEMALLTGSLLSLRDPYALASSGGVLSAEEMHDKADVTVSFEIPDTRPESRVPAPFIAISTIFSCTPGRHALFLYSI